MLELITLLQAAPDAIDLVRDGLALLKECFAARRDPTSQEIAQLNAQLQAHLSKFHLDAGEISPAPAD